MTRYYYSDGDGPRGPYEEDELRGLLGDGAVRPDTLVKEEGTTLWRPLSEALGLVGTAPMGSRLTPAPPPAAPGRGSIADELKKLHDLRQSGALSESEFQRAKEALLSGARPAAGGEPSATGAEVARLRLETELLRLDQEWQTDRQQYFVSAGRGWGGVAPSGSGLGMTIFASVFMVAFGIFWMGMATSAGAPGFFGVFGLVFIVFAIGIPIYYGSKYSAYNRAHEDYQRKRADVLGKLNEIDR